MHSQEKIQKNDILLGCTIDELKDLIKQVAHQGIPPHGIHESQTIRQLFFDNQVILSIQTKLSNLKLLS